MVCRHREPKPIVGQQDELTTFTGRLLINQFTKSTKGTIKKKLCELHGKEANKVLPRVSHYLNSLQVPDVVN